MAAEMGELVVGSYLKEVLRCDFVDYNVKPPVSGRAGQFEFDVLGLHFGDGTAFLCEVATHLDGLNYGGNEDTLDKLVQKHRRQRDYASTHLRNFPQHRFMFWSPYVPVGFLTEGLARVTRLELMINADYGQALDALLERAAATTRGTGNAFFRALQIMEHVRR